MTVFGITGIILKYKLCSLHSFSVNIYCLSILCRCVHISLDNFLASGCVISEQQQLYLTGN